MASSSEDDLTRASISTIAVTADAAHDDSVVGAAGSPHRFAPGSIIGGRYRVVALLGRGGMGDVYRAEDLTLDQPVAMKFLPGIVSAGDTRLAQFHNELKTARQVSHKNVCRLYDLGEADGRRFLTMEYVDGEDLSSLLRRIGRLPHDKAVDIARQLCAGIAAAHERGVIHRDLKPSNIMIDADGNVRITDFGIATAAGTATSGFAGTPQYMAPEQFSGRPASVKSDLYALGLILFEVFTGRRAIDAHTVQQLQEFHRDRTVTTPSSVVRDLDPAVERLILRCLDREPERRPLSALVVAAGLPGADPLAAALAAGETPSPDLLAAAGETSAIPASAGAVLFAMTLLGLLAFAFLSPRGSVAGRAPLDLPPAVLADRAGQVITGMGYPDTPGDRASGFARFSDYTRWLFATRNGPQRYGPITVGAPSPVLFWYRASPRSLRPLSAATVTLTDPPQLETGTHTVVLDSGGRLLEFRSVPPQVADEPGVVTPPWDRAFAAAGLDMTQFVPAEPVWVPRDYADSRSAWEGTLPAPSGTRVRVEAAAYHGRPVYFAIVGPWTQATSERPRQQALVDRVIGTAITLIGIGILAAAALLARRNLRTGRADARGAVRLATAVIGLGGGAWLLQAHHTGNAGEEVRSLANASATLVLAAAVLWTNYVALEPYVRKLWPDALLGWSRLLTGHLRDPRVGRDVLVGIAVGVAVALVQVTRTLSLPALGYDAPSATYATQLNVLSGAGQTVAHWLLTGGEALQIPLVLALLAVLLRLVLRRPILATASLVLAMAVPFANESGTSNTLLILVFPLMTGALLAWVLIRRGLLTLVVGWFVLSLLLDIPFVPDPGHWAAMSGNWTLALLVSLTGLALYAARAGQPLLPFAIRDL